MLVIFKEYRQETKSLKPLISSIYIESIFLTWNFLLLYITSFTKNNTFYPIFTHCASLFRYIATWFLRCKVIEAMRVFTHFCLGLLLAVLFYSSYLNTPPYLCPSICIFSRDWGGWWCCCCSCSCLHLKIMMLFWRWRII